MTTPPPAQFRSQSELILYLGTLERRVALLEDENSRQRQTVDQLYQERQGPALQPPALPKTGLLSNSFITRAFTVWGHYFTAQLIIGLAVGAVYLAIILLMIAVGNN